MVKYYNYLRNILCSCELKIYTIKKYNFFQKFNTFKFWQIKTEQEFEKPLNKSFFRKNKTFAKCKNFANLRENSQRFKLPAGKYVIVPSTFAANEEGDFLLRIFTEKENKNRFFYI